MTQARVTCYRVGIRMDEVGADDEIVKIGQAGERVVIDL